MHSDSVVLWDFASDGGSPASRRGLEINCCRSTLDDQTLGENTAKSEQENCKVGFCGRRGPHIYIYILNDLKGRLQRQKDWN